MAPSKPRSGSSMPIPASWSARKRAAAITGDVLPTGKPDIDNLVKAALDGVRGIVIGDDATLVGLQAWASGTASRR